jgi:UDP-glucose:tetrahydrobiopterin glucosyltransferase
LISGLVYEALGNTIGRPLKLLFLSTSVGTLGSGAGGGVELTLFNTALVLARRGHLIDIAAPTGSALPGFSVTQIGGSVQVPAQSLARDAPVLIPAESVIGNLWDYARQIQADFDLIVNFAYDWLPFYLTPFFETPIAHLVSMGSLSDAMDLAIGKIAARYPHSIGVYTKAQAQTFPFADRCFPLGSGLDLSLYSFCKQPGHVLGWLGRISPEKGLEDAVAAAQAVGLPLKVMGQVQDQAYFEQIQHDFPGGFEYLGFLSTQDMQEALRQCQALLVTSRWVEAFGNVLIEALACGVPVISYRRGGPAEIVRDGETGWLVEPDSVRELIAAIRRIDIIDRSACRRQAEAEYSLEALGDRTEAWFDAVLQSWPRGN